jgi:hypothetical protein
MEKLETIIPLKFNLRNMELHGKAVPLDDDRIKGVPTRFSIAIDDLVDATIEYTDKGWKSDELEDPELVETIGAYLQEWYE